MSAAAPSSPAASLIEIVTVGLPFCVFKLLTGLVMPMRAVSWLLLVLGAIDLLLNGVNLASLLVRGRRAVPVCALDGAARATEVGRARTDLGLALDVLTSFVLVAVMIGAGLLARLTPAQLAGWNVAVILNVLGAGFGRLHAALRTAHGS